MVRKEVTFKKAHDTAITTKRFVFVAIDWGLKELTHVDGPSSTFAGPLLDSPWRLRIMCEFDWQNHLFVPDDGLLPAAGTTSF